MKFYANGSVKKEINYNLHLRRITIFTDLGPRHDPQLQKHWFQFCDEKKAVDSCMLLILTWEYYLRPDVALYWVSLTTSSVTKGTRL